jgi:hypothetical protein
MTFAAPVRLSGVEAVKAARRVAAERRCEEWPYVHVFPPPNSVPVHQIAFIAAPAPSFSGVVLAYRVPAGMRFFMQSILQVYTAGASFSPGAALWTVTDNSPTGLADSQAMPIQGLINLGVPLGSLAAGTRWPFDRAYEFSSDHLLQSVVQNVSLSGGFFVSGFFGYVVPDL